MPYDSSKPPPAAIRRRLGSHCASKGRGLIPGTDTNSHNTVWGSVLYTNSRGDSLLYYIMSTNLTVCNKGIKGTFVNVAREQVLDLTLTTPKIESKIID